MKWPWTKIEQKSTALDRLLAEVLGTTTSVTPDNCLRSTTVRAIVTGIAGRIASMPIHIYQSSDSNGKESMEKVPNHPVANLLRKPNELQSSYDYWQDAISSYLRHGCHIAVKGQGSTGPIRQLFPIKPSATEIKEDGRFIYDVTNEYPFKKIHYVRGPSSDYFKPESIIKNIQKAIALEIAAEEAAQQLFQNGAIPLLIFSMTAGFQTPEDQKKFIEDFQDKFSGDKKFRAMMLPKNVDVKNPVSIDFEKLQLLDLRKLQTIKIAAAYGIPPHLVGILDNAHYNNIEQQELDLINTVILPIVQNFERAMERDLLTDKDRNSGIKIRFNVNANIRGDLKTQMEAIALGIANNLMTPNEGREELNRNPISSDDGGDQYYFSANLLPVGAKDATLNPNPTGNQNL